MRIILGLFGFEIICMHITEITRKNRPIPTSIRQLIHMP